MSVGIGAKKLTFTPDYSVFFSDENPEFNAFKTFQDTYTKNDNFYFVLKPKSGDVFSREFLTAIEDLTNKAWHIPYANRVDSLTNFQHTYAENRDDLVVEDLITGAGKLTGLQIEEKKKVALNEPLLSGYLVTANGDAAAVNVTLQLPKKTIFEVPTAAAKAREFKKYVETTYPNIEVYLTGFGMLNNAFGESGYMDSVKLVPLMYLILIIVAAITLRSFFGTLITVIIAYLSMGVGLGAGGFSGIYLTPISTSAPIVIITLAIADTIHVFLTARMLLREGKSKHEAIVQAMRLNYTAITITSLTSAIGFLTLYFSDTPPYWHLGGISAVGITTAWLLTMTLVPALISIFPIKAAIKKNNSVTDVLAEAGGKFIHKNAVVILTIGIIVSAGLISMIPKLQFNDQWSEYFDKSILFRTDTDSAIKHFGLYPIEYSIPAKGPQGVSDVEYLANLEKFTQYLREQQEAKHVYSITDVLKRLNKNMHGDDEGAYQLPLSHDLSSDYLLVYEMSLPYGLDLNDRINIDKSASRITVMLGMTSTIETKNFIDKTDAWVKDNLPPYMQNTRPTSAHVMFTYITDRNVESMISGTITGLIAITLVLIVTLGSVRLGVLSMIPNIIPILVAFGAWSLLVGSVGFSVAAVSSIALGIVVDDTVHYITKYQYARREKGLNPLESVILAFKTVSPAMISTTVILIAGFLVMANSTFKINADLGLLTMVTLTLAMVYDLILLPAILILFDRVKAKDSSAVENDISYSPTSTSTTTGLMVGVVAISLIATTFIPNNAHAQDQSSRVKGYEISKRSDQSDLGFTNSVAKVTMVLKNANGGEASRVMDVKTLEVPDDAVGDKSIVIFRQPADVSGTAFLSHAKIIDPDDQWLFLKSMNRTKRISSKNKSGPFMGSEFSFEDFTALELDKYDHEWVKDDVYEGMKCDVIKRVPKYEYSGYSSMLVWIDQDINQVRKIEYFDRKGDPLKTLVMDKYSKDAGYWRAMKWSMANHQTRKSTDLLFSDYKFNVGLTEGDFVKDRLMMAN
jgi:hypothetical protein